jgi:hypothetical protein
MFVSVRVCSDHLPVYQSCPGARYRRQEQPHCIQQRQRNLTLSVFLDSLFLLFSCVLAHSAKSLVFSICVLMFVANIIYRPRPISL